MITVRYIIVHHDEFMKIVLSLETDMPDRRPQRALSETGMPDKRPRHASSDTDMPDRDPS